MEFYRVLIADDEEEIRQGICEKIDWNSLGFLLVGQAENGMDALEKCDLLNPDILLTDIKMPFLDGLELCKKLKVTHPALKFVIFSGFDEFEYAKQAIGINVSEYILKPINATELSAILQNLRTELDQQRAQRKDIESLRARYAQSLPILREIFFTHLLDGRVIKTHIPAFFENYNLPFPSGAWVCTILDIDNFHTPYDFIQREELFLSVRSFFEDHFSLSNCWLRSVSYREMSACLFCLPHDISIYHLIAELERLRLLAENLLDLQLSIGVGQMFHEIRDLHLSAKQAASALDYRALHGGRQILYIGDLEPIQISPLSFDEQEEKELVSIIKLGQEQEIAPFVKKLLQRVQKENYTLNQCQFFFLELTTCLVRLTRANEIELSEIFGADFTGVIQIENYNSPDQLCTWFTQRCLHLHQQIKKRRTDSSHQNIALAKEFIEANFHDSNLSIDSICNYLHLSSAYFSTLFKRETGTTFTSYVTSVRMQEAARLLRETDEKTYLIAERTGYLDPNYFSYVFRRHFSISPSKFRAMQDDAAQTQNGG